ncbi:MAG: hypothetical protein KIT31_39810, partial [Deltaproteobacteria bacterium]|nr:hypothetical protein [Deltaproteobacteria bacterium]
MATSYVDAREYLDDAIALVERMLGRSRDDGRAAELEVEIAHREELMAARCRATAVAGRRVPLDLVGTAFGLSPTELRVLAVLAALELSADVRRAAGALVETAGPATLGLVEALVYRSPHLRSASAEELAEDGRLFTHSLAELGDAGLPWLARSVRPARRVLELALGRLRLDIDLANIAHLVEDPADGSQLTIDAKVRASVDEAVRRQLSEARTAVPLLVGPSGAGRC